MAMATNGNRLTDMEFDEISLVTRPANQLSKVVLFKSDTPEQEHMTSENEQSAEVEKAKGDKMPEELKRRFGIDNESEDDEDEDEMKKAKMPPAMDDEEDEEDDMDKMYGSKKMKKDDVIDLPSEVYEYIEALEAANSEMSDQLEKAAAEAAAEPVDTDILKSADPEIVAIVKAAEDRAVAAEKIAKAERDFRLEREFIAKAAELSALPAESEAFGKVLKSVAEAVDEDTFNTLMTVLTAANEGISTGNLFAELGKASAFDNDGPTGEINKAAARLIEANPGLSHEQAVAKAVDANPSLYNEYLRGN
jgi:hypothetical protein